MYHDCSLLSKKYADALRERYGKEFNKLTYEQQVELTNILGRTVEDHMERSMFIAGGHTLRELYEKMGGEILYGGIRGSVARADATCEDDVDLVVATEHPVDAIKLLKELAPRYGEALKLMVPKMKRRSDSLVTYLVIDRKDYGKFLYDPILLDMDGITQEFMKQSDVVRASEIIRTASKKIKQSRILTDLNNDPFKFVEDNFKPMAEFYLPGGVRKDWSKMSQESKDKLLRKYNKFVSHALIHTVARLVGVRLIGRHIHKRHKIIKLRDDYLRDFLDNSVSPCTGC